MRDADHARVHPPSDAGEQPERRTPGGRAASATNADQVGGVGAPTGALRVPPPVRTVDPRALLHGTRPGGLPLWLVRKLRPRTLAVRLRHPKSWYLLSRGTEPVSRSFGVDRGTPIDRYYIEEFLYDNRASIRGTCLEIGGDTYITRYGGENVSRYDVLDVDATNAHATIHGDLRRLDAVPSDAYDCVILTQVLQYIDDLPSALGHIARILAPRGVLLATVPSMQRMDPFAPADSEHWRMTPAGARYLLEQHFPSDAIAIAPWGNARVGMASWLGMAQEDLTRGQLAYRDPDFPCGVTMKAVKPRLQPQIPSEA